MEHFKANLRWVFPVIAVAVVSLQAAVPGNAQIPVSPCTASMLTSFTPCMNFLANNTANMSTPTPGCCTSIMSLASNGSGCLCQILTGGVPFQVPVNRTLAISLPRSCNVASVPFQCNLATSPPSSAPGPSSIAQTPAFSPAVATPPGSPGVALAPVSGTTPTLTPSTSPTATTETPTTSTSSPGKTSTPATSTANPSLALSPTLLLLPLALVMIKYY